MTFEYIRQSIFFFKQNFTSLALINLPFLIVFNFLFSQIDMSMAKDDPSSFTDNILLMSGLNLLFMPIYWGATIAYMQSSVEGPLYTPGQAIVASLKLWPKLFSVFLLSSIGIFFGLMAFVAPGVYVAIRLSIADYICVVEKQDTMFSLKQSWHLTAEYVAPIFKGVALIIMSIFLLKSMVSAVSESIFDSQGLQILINVFFDFINVLVMIYGFRIYCLIKAEL